MKYGKLLAVNVNISEVVTRFRNPLLSVGDC